MAKIFKNRSLFKAKKSETAKSFSEEDLEESSKSSSVKNPGGPFMNPNDSGGLNSLKRLGRTPSRKSGDASSLDNNVQIESKLGKLFNRRNNETQKTQANTEDKNETTANEKPSGPDSHIDLVKTDNPGYNVSNSPPPLGVFSKRQERSSQSSSSEAEDPGMLERLLSFSFDQDYFLDAADTPRLDLVSLDSFQNSILEEDRPFILCPFKRNEPYFPSCAVSDEDPKKSYMLTRNRIYKGKCTKKARSLFGRRITKKSSPKSPAGSDGDMESLGSENNSDGVGDDTTQEKLHKSESTTTVDYGNVKVEARGKNTCLIMNSKLFEERGEVLMRLFGDSKFSEFDESYVKPVASASTKQSILPNESYENIGKSKVSVEVEKKDAPSGDVTPKQGNSKDQGLEETISGTTEKKKEETPDKQPRRKLMLSRLWIKLYADEE